MIASNEDKWITIHPHGEESEDYRRLLIKDGETIEDAMHRQGYYDKRKAKEENKTKENDYKKYVELDKELSKKISDIYSEGDKGDVDKYNLKIRELTQQRKEIYSKLIEATQKELERIKTTDLNKLTLTELIEMEKDIKELGQTNGISYEDRINLLKKGNEIRTVKGKIEANEKAKQIGGYTYKLQQLAQFDHFSDLSSFSVELQKHIYDNYKTVLNKYPQIKYGGLKIEKKKDNVYASNTSLLNIITLNSERYNNLEDLKQSYKRTVQLEFHPQGTDYNSIITHELGHGLLEYIMHKTPKTGQEIKRNVLRKAKVKAKELKKHLSEYAMKNAHEFFAEAFAEYMTSKNPRPVAVEFGKEINNILEVYKLV